MSLFGQELRHRRKMKSHSQRSLARAVKISPTYLSKIENGKEIPSSELIQKLELALSLFNYDLFVFSDKVPPAVLRKLKKRRDLWRHIIEAEGRAA